MRRAAVMAAAVFAGGCSRDPGALVPAPPDGGDAQRLVTILDYVSSDYARAVHGRTVVSADEYDEQVKFVSDARALVMALLRSASGTNDPLVTAVGRVEAAVRAKAEPTEVARACRDAKAEAVARFGLRTVPTETPSLDRARTLYAQSCLPCHGAAGDARTERAAQLDPRPASFREPARLPALSPSPPYNTPPFAPPPPPIASPEPLPPS